MPTQNSPWLTHASWSLAALAAFALGSLRTPSSGPAQGSDAVSPANSRPGSVAIRASGPSSSADNSRPDRQTTATPDSLLAGLFGSKTSEAGLDALAQQAIRDPSQIARRLAFSRLLEAMTPENALQIRTQLADLGADREQWRDFNYAWGALAGKSAFDDPATSKQSDRADVLTGWAATKPTEALAFLDNLPPELEKERADLTRGLVSGLADTDRALATELVLKLNSQGNKNASELLQIVATEAVRGDGPLAASQWSETLPNGPLKGAAMGLIAEEFARRSPEEAAAWAGRHASEEFAIRAIEKVSDQWTAQNPQAAVGWLETLPPGKGQSSGLQTAFNNWEDTDPVGAGEYLLAMPNSPQRDISISGFSNGYAWQNPQLAIEWAASIADADLRQKTLTHSGQIFFRQNPAAAKTWLDASELPAELKQQIQTPMRR